MYCVTYTCISHIVCLRELDTVNQYRMLRVDIDYYQRPAYQLVNLVYLPLTRSKLPIVGLFVQS